MISVTLQKSCPPGTTSRKDASSCGSPAQTCLTGKWSSTTTKNKVRGDASTSPGSRVAVSALLALVFSLCFLHVEASIASREERQRRKLHHQFLTMFKPIWSTPYDAEGDLGLPCKTSIGSIKKKLGAEGSQYKFGVQEFRKGSLYTQAELVAMHLFNFIYIRMLVTNGLSHLNYLGTPHQLPAPVMGCVNEFSELFKSAVNKGKKKLNEFHFTPTAEEAYAKLNKYDVGKRFTHNEFLYGIEFPISRKQVEVLVYGVEATLLGFNEQEDDKRYMYATMPGLTLEVTAVRDWLIGPKVIECKVVQEVASAPAKKPAPKASPSAYKPAKTPTESAYRPGKDPNATDRWRSKLPRDTNGKLWKSLKSRQSPQTTEPVKRRKAKGIWAHVDDPSADAQYREALAKVQAGKRPSKKPRQ